MRSQILNEHLSKLLKIASDALTQTDLSGIDQQSDKVRHALKELSDAYEYASQSIRYAFQASKSIQEMRLLEGQVLDGEVDMQPTFQEYTHKIEQILDHLANRLVVVVHQNKGEDFLSRGLYPIQSAFNVLVKGRKEGN